MNNENYLFINIKKGKKKMKKILLLLICIAMTFTLIGCNTNTGNEEGKTTYAEEIIVSYNNDLDTADPYRVLLHKLIGIPMQHLER